MNITSFLKPSLTKIVVFLVISFLFIPFIEYDTGIRCFTTPCPSGRVGSLLQYFVSSYHGNIYHIDWSRLLIGLAIAYFLSALILLLKINWKNFFALRKSKVMISLFFLVITVILYMGDCVQNCGAVSRFLLDHAQKELLTPLRLITSPVFIPAGIFVGGFGTPSFRNTGFIIIALIWFYFLLSFIYYFVSRTRKQVGGMTT